MKKRNMILTTVMSMIALLLVCGVVYAVNPAQQAEAYAHKIFPSLMEDFANNIENDSYFKNAEDVKAASLGEPIIIYNLDAIQPGKSMIEQLKQVAWYAFPVEVNGTPVTDFRVTLVNGDWVWDFGGSLSPMINQVAAENNIDAKECSAIMLGQPGPTYIVANKAGKEVAIRNYKNPKTLKLNPEVVQEMQMELDAKQEIENNMLSEEGLIGSNGNFGISLKQNANVFQRVITYLDYLAM